MKNQKQSKGLEKNLSKRRVCRKINRKNEDLYIYFEIIILRR